ncbi:MAG: NfeD family protein [Oscillatoriaceae cyanobacterium Prado104]|nr:NfeD family protein [Oscillatoriaceae cyanobacterium Prado104]
MIQQWPSIVARTLALAKQLLNEIAFDRTIAVPAQPVLAVDRAERFENRAVVDEEIRPDCVGRVRFHGTYWNARCDLEIVLPRGEIVCVVGQENITLVVQPL